MKVDILLALDAVYFGILNRCFKFKDGADSNVFLICFVLNIGSANGELLAIYIIQPYVIMLEGAWTC